MKNTIPILFENDDVLAVDKPEGVPTIPGRGNIGESLLAMLSSTFPEKLYVVHRLDRDTSGVVLFAKNAAAHRFINKRFGARDVRKNYLALVRGNVRDDEGVISKSIRRFGSGRMGVDKARGKPSETAFRVVTRAGGFTLIEAYPMTGRLHQVRVHFYSMGHPIAGDRRYGPENNRSEFPRLMLHAKAISFSLPAGDVVTVESPLPVSFTRVWDGIRGLRD